MKRLKVGAAGLAFVLAVCSAFTNARTVKADETSYGVTQVNATTYTVEDITGQTEGEDYLCDQNQPQPCVITADSSNVVNEEVQKSDASIVTTGDFQPLQP